MTLYKQFATKNKCYIRQKYTTVKGIFVHSTGADNPWLKRYVQPDDGRLGVNNNGNSFNEYQPGGRSVCVNAFIGKLKDGSIATYQTLPWNMASWHSGVGSKGSANNMGYIGFEICEDDLTDKAYCQATYKEAAELCAYLCKMFDLNPLKDGVILSHAEGAKRGIASNHADTGHWWSKHGLTMDGFRKEVYKIMNSATTTATTTTQTVKKDELDMTKAEFIASLTNEEAYSLVQKANAYLKEQSVSTWAQNEGYWDKAKAAGIVDGSSPRGNITREQIVTVLGRLGLIK